MSSPPLVRSLSCALVGLFVIHGRVAAQEQEPRVSFTVSPGFITFRGFGGSFGTAVARLSVSRGFTTNTGGELALFAVAPTGGASISPGCVQGSPCESRSTPSLLSGVVISGYAFAGRSPLRVLGGVGAIRASGGDGLDHRATAIAVVGLEWVPRGPRGLSPTLGVRLAQLSSPVAGARQLFLPGVGLSF